MPTFKYVCDNDHEQIDFVPLGRSRKAHMKCKCCGQRSRYTYTANFKPPSTFNKPSWAMAVHPSQIPEAQAHLAKAGVKTDFNSRGEPIMRDNGHRNAHMAAFGYHDNDACYGQRTKGKVEDES